MLQGTFKASISCIGYTTLRRTTLRLLSHFVEKAFCRSVILSNVHFVETGFRRIFSTKYSCSPDGHIVSADPVTMYHVIVRLRTLAKITGLKLTISFYKGARE